MADTSPMMQRIRRGHGRQSRGLYIPRRGRIRAVLALLVGLVVLKIAWHPSKSTSASPVSPPARKNLPGVTAPSDQHKKHKSMQTPSHHSVSSRRPLWSRLQALFTLQKTSGTTDDPGIVEKLPFPSLETPPVDTVKHNGRFFAVRTSIDPLLQQTARRLMRRYAPRYGAAVAMEPATGRVLCLVSFSGDTQADMDSHLYCRSFFPAASIFKAVTAAAAIETRGLDPASALPHAGASHTLYKFQLAPHVESARDMTLNEAFAYSINSIFGRIGLYVVGCSTLYEYARRLGFATKVPFLLPVDSAQIAPCDSSFALAELASGFNRSTTLSPILATMIASAVAEDGVMMRPSLIDSIVDLESMRTVFRMHPAQWKTPLQPNTVAHLRMMMASVARFGTARESFRYLRNSFRFRTLQYGGKTGSIDKDGLGRIDWFIGFIRSDADKRQRLAAGVVTVHGSNWTVHSSFIAAELMRIYIREIQRAYEDSNRPQPSYPLNEPAASAQDSTSTHLGG